ncbi:MAG: YHS domain-containing protein [Planctomycetaceae bacterium]|nr:YHS domain-containing protein [Planctomycetaceae bacterium]
MKISLLITIAALAAIFLLGGCKDKTAPAPQSSAANQISDVTADASVAAETEQTACPVMGGAINKEIFTEYQGKKVYFCCPACKPEFEKDPEKYLSKLPQFKK